MANEYAVNQADLTAVADAIRTKGGTSDALAFPAGFVSAVAAITAGTGGSSSGLAYDMGEFVLEADNGAPVVPHNLGAVPEFILVWTEDFYGITENSRTDIVNTCMLYVSNPWGLQQRLTSTANTKHPMNVVGSLSNGSVVQSVTSTTSSAYGMQELPTETEFKLSVCGGANYQWRAGITYKYFVSEAPWL